MGVVICEDIWQDGGPVSQMDENEVSLLVVLNASPYEEGKGHQRVELAARRAHEVEAPVAYVNMVGGAGRPRVRRRVVRHRRPTARCSTRAPQFVEHLLVWDLLGDDDAPATGPIAPPLAPDEEVYRALVTGLRGYVTQERVPSVVLGMSGGHRLGAGRRDRRGRARRRERRRRLDAVGVLLGAQQGRRRRTWPSGSAPTTGCSRSRRWSTRSRASSRSRASPRRTCRPASAA